MSHSCFVSFKKEDEYYKEKILNKLGKERIIGKSLEDWIDSEDLDYVTQKIRKDCMDGTTVTLYLIGKHSSENEGFDYQGRNIQSFVIRELQATLFDRVGNPRHGLLGIVLPEMENEIYKNKSRCSCCGAETTTLILNDTTVLREFWQNYWIQPEPCGGHYNANGEFCVLVRYSDFMADPDKYIDMAYERTKKPIAKRVKVYCDHKNVK